MVSLADSAAPYNWQGAHVVTAARSRSQLALRFFVVSATALGIGGALAAGLVRIWPSTSFPRASFPPVFVLSSVALFAGSVFLSQAISAVRREKQARFRRMLLFALIAGAMFVALQTTALNWLIRRQTPEEASTGPGAFVAVFASLHAMHFVVALMFLSFVTVQAWADRYDHEYCWGVTVCAWFWHALGVVWLAVLVVAAIAIR